jgi:hypothetical protein
MKKISLACLAAAAIAAASPALACSCVMRSAEERAAQSTAIFIGTATRTTSSEEEGSDTVYTAFTVKEMLKGTPATEVYVSHPADLGGNCGVDFEAGQETLVLASAENPDMPLRTNLCELTGADEAEIRAALKTKETSAP